MIFLEKFLAAWFLVGVALAGITVCAVTIAACITGWMWLMAHVPTWAQWTLNIVVPTAIAALIIVFVADLHGDD